MLNFCHAISEKRAKVAGMKKCQSFFYKTKNSHGNHRKRRTLITQIISHGNHGEGMQISQIQQMILT